MGEVACELKADPSAALGMTGASGAWNPSIGARFATIAVSEHIANFVTSTNQQIVIASHDAIWGRSFLALLPVARNSLNPVIPSVAEGSALRRELRG